MGLGDELFNAAGSPFKKVAKAAALILAVVAVFDQPLFDNWMMDFVNTETPHYMHVIEHALQGVTPHLAPGSTQPAPSFSWTVATSTTSTTTTTTRP